MTAILRAIAAGGPRATKLADVICRLVVEGGHLGELEQYQIADLAKPRVMASEPAAMKVCRGLPRAWLDRLDTAIETGAIDAMPASKIVEILLQGRSGT